MAALGINSYPIEGFSKRIELLIAHMPPDVAYLGSKEPKAIRNPTEPWRAICRAAELDEVKSLRTWKRCVSGKNAIPDSIVGGLLKVYPGIAREAFIRTKFSEFQSVMASIESAQNRWINATKYLAHNRAPLTALSKRYYERIDEAKKFPLVAKQSWLLDRPFLLKETSPLPLFNRMIPDVTPPRLEGLTVDYVVLRQLMSRKAKLWNGDGYRVLNVATKNKGRHLEISLGPSTYFSFVNSLEAAAVEMADFALQNSLACVPEKLIHRGPPEAIFQFDQRSAYASVSCIMFLKNYFVGTYSDHNRRKKNKFILHHRGDDAFVNQNLVAGVPAGGHQPFAKDFGDDSDRSIWRTVVREFCEELFNKEEAAQLRSHGEEFIELPEIKPYVDSFFRSGASKIFVMGIGIEPLTTQPDILITIVVDWSRVTIRAELKIEENFEGEAILYDLSREELVKQANLERRSKALHPSAKAGLLLAAKHYDFLMG